MSTNEKNVGQSPTSSDKNNSNANSVTENDSTMEMDLSNDDLDNTPEVTHSEEEALMNEGAGETMSPPPPAS